MLHKMIKLNYTDIYNICSMYIIFATLLSNTQKEIIVYSINRNVCRQSM